MPHHSCYQFAANTIIAALHAMRCTESGRTT